MRRAKQWRDDTMPNPGGDGPHAAVIFLVDAMETALLLLSSLLSLLLSSGLGATAEETNRRDEGGCREKRR
jgi:hypothetical protein